MTIHYKLYENTLTTNPNDFRAVIQYIATVKHDAVLKRMAESGLTVSKEQANAIIDKYFETLYHFILLVVNR